MGRQLPIRDRDFQTANFAAWLARHGAEVGIPTNPYEVIRYKAFWEGKMTAATHIVYAKGNGLLTYTGASAEHYRAFINDLIMPATSTEAEKQRKPQAKKTQKIAKPTKIRLQLRERDGPWCWYCGVELTVAEATIEHLIPKSDGGLNSLTNLVLAHEDCNRRAGNAPLAAKIELRAAMRAEQATKAPWAEAEGESKCTR